MLSLYVFFLRYTHSATTTGFLQGTPDRVVTSVLRGVERNTLIFMRIMVAAVRKKLLTFVAALTIHQKRGGLCKLP